MPHNEVKTYLESLKQEQKFDALNENIRLKVLSEEIGYDDLSFYFHCVLIGNIMNFRNNFAHGIGLKNFSSRHISDILFHVLICLSLVATEEDNQ